MKTKLEYIIGIDEVGRGPIAGPVAVGALVYKKSDEKKIKKIFAGIRDSKKLTPQKRKEWLDVIDTEKRKGNLNYCVSFVNNAYIDKNGISNAIKKALKCSIDKVCLDSKKSFVYLDGGLKAPQEYLFQETVIKGDDKIMAISMASVAAKVIRDKKMEVLSKKFPHYCLDIHKGYGTKNHYEKIKTYGISGIHRKSFLKNYY